MSDIAIRAEGIGKLYHLGHRERYRTLRDTLTETFTAPFRRSRRNAGAAEEADTFWALKNVSFEVRQGDVVGIVGSNGAGKSTLLKVLSRITEPTRGEARIHGRIASLLEVGTGFHPELSGRDNIFLNGAILGMKKTEIQAKFDEIVAFAEVDQFIDTPVKRYSSGMYVRLAFSVAAHLETEILIIDEVLAVGDSAFQRKCLGRMGTAASEGRTVLFVSHNMTALQTLCNRAIWLSKGEVKADGTPHAVVGEYLHTSANTSLEREWDDRDTKAGNDSVRLHSARIIADDMRRITIADPFEVELNFANYVEGASLHATIHIYTLEGICVLSSASPAHEMAAGRATIRCQIPKNLLNDGCYRIQWMIVQNMATVLIYCADAIIFEVHEGPRAIAWYGKWPGIVRPDLAWHCDVPLHGAERVLAGQTVSSFEPATPGSQEFRN